MSQKSRFGTRVDASRNAFDFRWLIFWVGAFLGLVKIAQKRNTCMPEFFLRQCTRQKNPKNTQLATLQKKERMWLLDFSIPKISRPWVLFALLVIEIVLLVFLIRSQSKAAYGFLFKDGKEFKIAWNTEGREYLFAEHSSLASAVNYAEKELHLKLGQNPVVEFQFEHAWSTSRPGRDIVFWKTTGYGFLHQITFSNAGDATAFLRAIRGGAYSPSPFGNALLLVPE